MQTVRKSRDGQTIMVMRSTGLAVSTRDRNGTAWKTEGTHLTQQRADALFNRFAR